MSTRSRSEAIPAGAGRPRLVVASNGRANAGSPEAQNRQREFVLDEELITIGSARTQSIQLAGLDPEF